MREERVVKNLKVALTDPELLELSRKMAKAQQDLNASQDRKAEIMSELSAQIKRHHADVQDFSRIIGNGYEFRDVECRVIFDHPDPGIATVVRLDDCSEVESRRMTDQERQLSIRFHERVAAQDEATADPPVETTAGVCPTCQGAPSSGELVCPDCNGSGKPSDDIADDEQDESGEQ